MTSMRLTTPAQERQKERKVTDNTEPQGEAGKGGVQAAPHARWGQVRGEGRLSCPNIYKKNSQMQEQPAPQGEGGSARGAW